MRKFCKQCSKDITNENQYSITLLDYRGEEYYVYCCSEECCLKIQENNAEFHMNRYKKVMSEKPYLCIKKEIKIF